MNLKQQAGAARRLLNPATGEEDTLKKEALKRSTGPSASCRWRSASPGISIASG